MSSKRNAESSINLDHGARLTVFNPLDDILDVFETKAFNCSHLLFFYLNEIDKRRRQHY
jgi:hypothetical protein